ncbi:HK97-gp10 family putative phage morphogenesis protein [Clostridium septicum]|uniref:HK97-gp10 family putative phage morphogenesis protein n=1 Tax=Clostridium septicum TaxID=1504 RepID=UPI0008321A2F|nr:HK97-gp10 family putative phage morphogenesis protein [Clostridium septicum]WLF70891.1 HK97 gp10 family phage protein [Clostridium septicum]
MSRSVVGLDNLLKKLNKLGGNVEETLYKSMQRQGELVKGDAKDLCPVDTGDLRQSIKSETKNYKNKITTRVYTNSDHAAYVEFGTGKVGERTNKNNKVNVSYKQDKWLANIPDVGVRWVEGEPAQPYLYPALKNNEKIVVENIKEDVKKEIERISRR